MANKISAKKRIRQTITKNKRNSTIRSTCRTAEKKVRTLAAEGDLNAAKDALKDAESKYAKACTKGVYHKNNVSRRVSRLNKLVAA